MKITYNSTQSNPEETRGPRDLFRSLVLTNPWGSVVIFVALITVVYNNKTFF